MAQNGDAWILKLPNELLGPILHASTKDPESEGREHLYTHIHRTRTLVKVCRRFHEIATPFLYDSLSIRCPSERVVKAYQDEYYIPGRKRGENSRGELLHRTLGENASLRSHCHSLSIEVGNSTPFRNLSLAADCISWLTAITTLEVSLEPRGYAYDGDRSKTSCLKLVSAPHNYCCLLSVASRYSRHLQELYLGGEYLTHSEFILPDVVRVLAGFNNAACLRKLNLSGVAPIGSDKDWSVLEAGTAPFTEIFISQFVASHQALKALIMWPARLEKFRFWLTSTDFYAGDFADPPYTLGSLQSVLWGQRDSLTHLRLRELYTEGIEGFDLTQFTKLKDLHISHDLTGTDTTLIGNLVAPSLEVLHWDQTLEDQQCGERLEYFNQPEEDWLRAFSSMAIERRSALRRIEIIYHPEPSVHVDKDSPEPVYPWDRMDSVARDIRPHGIELTYNTPTITREEYWAEVRDQQRPEYAAEQLAKLEAWLRQPPPEPVVLTSWPEPSGESEEP